MEIKKKSAFTDRELLETILINHIQFERRLDRIEIYLGKVAMKDDSLNKKNYNYWADDGREGFHTDIDTFKELLSKAIDIKEEIKEILEIEDSEMS